MDTKKVYATCFSCSTKESIAMWMLYGNHGKQGAMLNFYPTVMKELLQSPNVDLGSFDFRNQFIIKYTLKLHDDYDVYLSDVVYTEECNNDRVRLTLNDKHATANSCVLEDKYIFHKSYAWSYEKECRLIVSTTEKWSAKAKREELPVIRLKLSPNSIAKMKTDRLFRSPVYQGGVSIGMPSELTDDVDWSL